MRIYLQRSMSNQPSLGYSDRLPAISHHIPVLLQEVAAGLNLSPGMKVIDGTLGGGGHCSEFLTRIAPDGKILGIDADPYAINRTRDRFSHEIIQQRLFTHQSRYVHLEEIVQQPRYTTFQSVDAIFLDLGVSSFQLDQPERGFSFSRSGPLDMRMDTEQILDAEQIVNHWSEHEIAHLIYTYGEEHRSRPIARSIVQQRPIRDTEHLAQVVAAAKTKRARQGHRQTRQSRGRAHAAKHPATLTFQALRIAVNEELSQLQTVLPTCLDLLKPGGRMAIISFHSLEDAIVKHWMKAQARTYTPDPHHPYGGYEQIPTLKLITPKPIVPTEDECAQNPRSRSAKLRIAQRLQNVPGEQPSSSVVKGEKL